MRGGSGERLGSWGVVQGGAPEVWGQVFAGVGFAAPDGWSGMGAPGECRVGGREGASVRGGGGVCCCLGSSSPASRSSAARCGPRAFGSQRQRKSLKTFFPLLPTSSSLLPLLLPLLPAVAAAAAGAAAARLRLWGLGLLLGGSFLRSRLRPARRAAPSPGGAPEGASPLPPAGGLAVWRIRGGRREVGRPGARRAAAAGPAGAAGVFEAAPAPPRKRAGRGRPSGGRHGGAGPRSASRVGGLQGGSLKPGGRGRGPGSAPPTGCCLLAVERHRSGRQ